MEALMIRLGLEVNKAKTRIARLPEQLVRFFWVTRSEVFMEKTGAYTSALRPSKKAVRSLLKRIHDRTTPQWFADTPLCSVARISAMLRGWCGYFNQGPIMATREQIRRYTEVRLRRWLMRRSGHPGDRIKPVPIQVSPRDAWSGHRRPGLGRRATYRMRRLDEIGVSRMRGKSGTSGLMSGMCSKRGTVRTMRNRQPKGSGTARPDLTYRATSLTRPTSSRPSSV